MKRKFWSVIILGITCLNPGNKIYPEIGLFFESCNGIINTGYKDITVNIIDTFNQTINQKYKTCQFSENSTSYVDSKQIFHEMMVTHLILYGFEYETVPIKLQDETTPQPMTTTQVTGRKRRTSEKSTHKISLQVLEDEIFNQQKTNFNYENTIECHDRCYFTAANSEIFDINMPSKSNRIQVKFFTEHKDLSQSIKRYKKTLQSTGMEFLGYYNDQMLVMTAIKNNDLDYTLEVKENITIQTYEGTFNLEKLTGMIAWTKNRNIISKIQIDIEEIETTTILATIQPNTLYYEQYGQNIRADYYKRKRRSSAEEEHITKTQSDKLENTRQKRSFFGLASLDDVDSKITTAINIATKLRIHRTNDMNKKDLIKLAQLIQTNGIAITKTTNTISDVIGHLCTLSQSQQRTFIEQGLRIRFMTVINHITTMLSECRRGDFPQATISKLINKLCHTHIHPEHCIWANSILRESIQCRLEPVLIGTTHILIKFKLKVPVNFKENYTLYKPHTIPVFQTKNSTKVITDLDDKMILKWGTNPSKYQILNDCEEKKGIFVCSTEVATSTILQKCITQIMINNEAQCPTDTKNTKRQCFTKMLNDGLLISSKNRITIHSQDHHKIFNTGAQSFKGVKFIPNQERGIKMVNCEDIAIQTTEKQQTQIKNVEIISTKWIDEGPISKSRWNKLELTLDENKQKLNSQIGQINKTIKELKEKTTPIQFDEFIPEKEKSKSLLLGMLIALMTIVILGTIGIAIYCVKCRKKKETPEVERIRKAILNQPQLRSNRNNEEIDHFKMTEISYPTTYY